MSLCLTAHCAQRAGAIYADSGGSVTVTETTLSSNWANWAVRSSQPAPALHDYFVTLVCARKGGAVYVGLEGYANITRTTLSANTAYVRVTEPGLHFVMSSCLCAARSTAAR